MKQAIDLGFLWHLDQVVFTFQTTIVTTVDSQGRVNAAPFGLAFPFSSSADNPQMMLGSNRMWHTAQNIEAGKEFVINYASCDLIEKVALAGLPYAEGINELEKAGLTPLESLRVKPPRIKECFQHIECRLNHIIEVNQSQRNYIGDVLAISMNSELLHLDKPTRLVAANPLLLFGMDVATFRGCYAGVGKTTAHAPAATDAD
jgi:flavin reductase (DIM6/NTAB) family NADH-FMN oxidoreductase RutF